MTLLDVLAQPAVVALAILLVVASAAGISLYATLAGLGIASRLDLMPALPPALTGLENGLVIGTAASLLLIEALADREPAFAGMWHTLHALVKPVAAALLTASALAGTPGRDMLFACILAGLAAFIFHAIRYGARVAARMPNAPRGSFLLTLAEAVLALALLAPLRYPSAVMPAAGALILLMLLAGPLGYRAFRLGVNAQRARLRAFLGESGWSERASLPRSLGAALPATPLGATPPRATRIGVLRAPGLGRFQLGWLVCEPGANRVLASSLRGRRRVTVPFPASARIAPGTWADVLEVEAPAAKLRILLLKDGPAPALVAHALALEPADRGRVDLEKA